ncbi:hypothetical protein KY321_02935 [Candidatus Woesearchaeota archaeon]|nr:hypothetical protein [Candidatus Woesearchaeota archaeon]
MTTIKHILLLIDNDGKIVLTKDDNLWRIPHFEVSLKESSHHAIIRHISSKFNSKVKDITKLEHKMDDNIMYSLFLVKTEDIENSDSIRKFDPEFINHDNICDNTKWALDILNNKR